MKKLLLTTALIACCFNLLLAQPCLPEGITFTTQTQIDSFYISYPGCTEIEGDVTIGGEDWTNPTNITNLEGLNLLNSIGGALRIGSPPYNGPGNPALTSLSGLESLNSVGGDIVIIQNDALTNLSGLDNISSISGTLQISYNESLTNLEGLESLDVDRRRP